MTRVVNSAWKITVEKVLPNQTYVHTSVGTTCTHQKVLIYFVPFNLIADIMNRTFVSPLTTAVGWYLKVGVFGR